MSNSAQAVKDKLKVIAKNKNIDFIRRKIC